jgi:hypothetical protein
MAYSRKTLVTPVPLSDYTQSYLVFLAAMLKNTADEGYQMQVMCRGPNQRRRSKRPLELTLKVDSEE